MIAAAESAYDLWAWKADASGTLGVAEDQFTADASRRESDGLPLSTANLVGDVARYVFVSGTSAVSNDDPIRRSQMSDLLASRSLAEWHPATGRYVLADGTPVEPVNSFTVVSAYILEDQSFDARTGTVATADSYANGRWAVVLSRDLIVTGESSPQQGGAASLADTDYAFPPTSVNYFSFAVTDNSATNHKGVRLVSLLLQRPGEGFGSSWIIF